MNDKHKGQAATEFLLYTGVFMFMVIAAFAALSFVEASEIPAKEALVARTTGDGIVDSINLAVGAGRGYNSTVIFPRVILGRPFTLSFVEKNGNFVILDWQSSGGQVSQSYTLAGYRYTYEGCVSGLRPNVTSNKCRNSLNLYNNGTHLIISQES